MRVLVFALAPLWSPHFETDLELIAKHESAGDDVFVVTCSGALRSCIANPYHRELDCIACRSKCRRGLDAVRVEESKLEIIPLHTPNHQIATSFTSIEELSSLELGGIAIGKAAASSLISILRDSNPDMSHHADLAERLIGGGMQMASAATNAIQKHAPDLVYLFNGRFATAAPIVDVCERLGVAFRTHDALYSVGQYLVADSATVHDIDSLKEQIGRCWDEASNDHYARDERASQFFEHRRFGGAGAGPKHLWFSSSQVEGRIPETAAAGYVVILNSSEDEFSSLNLYTNPVYPDQMAALKAIVDAPELMGLRFVLRVHPNLSGLENEQTRQIEALADRPNLDIVAAKEHVDTYALMEGAESVVTFGSTTGIEAVYWGTPSILIGRAPFEDLGPVRAKNHRQVVEMILRPPPPAPREGALKYGYFMLEGGQRFEYYQQVGYNRGRVNGTRVQASWVARNARLVRNLLRGAWDLLARTWRTDNRKISQR